MREAMTRVGLLAAALTVGAVGTGCDAILAALLGDTGTDVCAAVDCSGHGSCAAADGAATCSCETGFKAAGLACVVDVPAATVGAVFGQVVDGRNNNPIGNAKIAFEAQTLTSNEQGFFNIEDMQPSDRVLLGVTAVGYARGTKVVAVRRGASTYVKIGLLPFDAETSFDRAAGGTLSGAGASVSFPAAAFSGSGQVTARLSVLNASDQNQLASFPGDFSAEGGSMLESFGALAIEVVDDSGALLNLATGKNAQITIPVNGAPDSVPLWSFDEDTGLWKQEGTLTGCSDGTCDSATISHLSWWNCDQVLETSCVNVCIKNPDGSPARGVSIEASGTDYQGRSYGYSTEDDGCACIAVKRGGTVSIAAVFSGGIAGPVSVTAPSTAAQCGDATCLNLDAPLVVATPKFQAILTWGEAPSDLDTHFTGPCDPADGTCVSRFHVYYSSEGYLAQPPWAFLDTDDTDSFGPEILTLTQCIGGVYRYSIKNYSGTPGFEVSGASIFVTLPGGQTQTIPVPTSLPNDVVWVVGDLTCSGGTTPSATCACTWQTVNTFGPDVDTTYNP